MERKKTGVITFHNAINYGALLQTYALQTCLISMGYESVVINYSNENINKIRKKPYWRDYKNLYNYHNDKLIYEIENIKERKLKHFLDTKINKTEEINKDNIKEVTSGLDIVFTGSDQVWNDDITQFDDTYYLDFVSPEKKCSYAASIGKELIPVENLPRVQKLLSDFRAISVREETAKKAIKSQLGISTTRVLDPTLLLSDIEYKTIAEIPDNKQFVLLYMLLYSETLVNSAKKLAKERGVPLLCINSSGKRIKGVIDCSDAGIEQWIGLFLQADFIFTNSFHGTAFSINFNKQFNVELPPAKIKASSRVKDILDLFKLEDRIINEGNINLKQIDFTEVNEILKFERDQSKEFIINAIEAPYITSNKVEKSILSISWDHFSGCGYCANVCNLDAIEMKSDNHGFMHPNVNLNKCVQCGLCLEMCPYKLKEANKVKEPDFQKIYAAYSNNLEVVNHSSSGGIFYELAVKIIQEDGVVYGATFDDDYSLIHKRIDKIEEIKPLMGSKYVQSDSFKSFDFIKKDLELGKKVLFVGTPCQVSALRQLFNKNDKNLFLIDFVCHGVPSQMLLKDHINYVESYFKSKIKEYIPRSKIMGWGHNELFTFSNGLIDFIHPITQAYKRVFHSSLALRGSCYNCPYTNFNRPGDLTLADYWGIDLTKPELFHKEGVSMILVNNEKGCNLINNVNSISKTETDKSTILEMKQPHLFHPVKKHKECAKFWSDYKRRGWEYITEKYAECDKKSLLKWKIKKILKRLK